MSHLAFARKYRPQAFDEIVGQDHITTTLKNAILQNRVAHAYLFTGSRGVGKTTTARILAKALNCEKGPAVDFCNKCHSCAEITQGVNLDVLEIDGASNRGIDEIRALRDNVKFLPSKGKFRIYIIDEVHMLTQEAFNALLKTLEEPPPHVKFIFATTQPHKVPATILSRCQRFDFRRIPARAIFERLKAIAGAEKFDVSDDVLSLVAKYADGSMRDGQVILDQAASFSGGKVTVDDITRMLGVADEDTLFGLSGSIKERDAVKAVRIIARLVEEGKDIVQAILDLIEHFRNMALIKIGADAASAVEAGPEKMKRYEIEASKFSIEEILYVIYTLAGAIDFARKSNVPRIPFETAMIKLARLGNLTPIGDILKKLDSLVHSPQPIVDSPKKTERRGIIGETQAKNAPPPDAKQDKSTSDNTNDASRFTLHERRDSPDPQAHQRSANLDEIVSAWSRILGFVGQKKMSSALYLQEGRPVNLAGMVLTIGFPKSSKFHKEALESPDQRKILEESVKEILGLDVRTVIVYDDTVQASEKKAELRFESAPPEYGPDHVDAPPEEDDPIIKSARDIFGGEVIKGGLKRRAG